MIVFAEKNVSQVVGSLFFMKLLVGVVYYQFLLARQEARGITKLTPSQKHWTDVQTRLTALGVPVFYQPPTFDDSTAYQRFRLIVHGVVTRKAFRNFVVYMIGANVLCSMTMHFGQPKEVVYFVRFSGLAFAIVFMMEVVARLVGVGLRVFLKRQGNWLTLVLVFWAALDIIVSHYEGKYGDNILDDDVAPFLHAWRTFGLLRVFFFIPTLTTLYARLRSTLAALTGVAALMTLIFFVLAVLGHDLFAGVYDSVKDMEEARDFLEDKYGHYDSARLSDMANFDSFLRAIQMLFRIATADRWSGSMHAVAHACSMAEPGSALCASWGSWLAYVFFPLSYIFLSFYFLNLIFCIIFENFYEISTFGTGAVQITQHDLDTFTSLWTHYQSKSQTRIPVESMHGLLSKVPYPLGLDTNSLSMHRDQELSDDGDSDREDDQEIARMLRESFADRSRTWHSPLHRPHAPKHAHINSQDKEDRFKYGIDQIIMSLDMPVNNDGTVSFHALIRALVYRLTGRNIPHDLQVSHDVRDKLASRAVARHQPGVPALLRLMHLSLSRAAPFMAEFYYTPAEWLAACKIQSFCRTFIRRRNLHKFREQKGTRDLLKGQTYHVRSESNVTINSVIERLKGERQRDMFSQGRGGRKEPTASSAGSKSPPSHLLLPSEECSGTDVGTHEAFDDRADLRTLIRHLSSVSSMANGGKGGPQPVSAAPKSGMAPIETAKPGNGLVILPEEPELETPLVEARPVAVGDSVEVDDPNSPEQAARASLQKAARERPGVGSVDSIDIPYITGQVRWHASADV